MNPILFGWSFPVKLLAHGCILGVCGLPQERGLTLLLSVLSPKVRVGVVNEELVQKLRITLFV